MKNKTIFDDGVFHPENEQGENLNIFREAFDDKDSMIISQTNGYCSRTFLRHYDGRSVV